MIDRRVGGRFVEQWQAAGDAADRLSWLAAHRLLGVVGLLGQRGLLGQAELALAEQVASKGLVDEDTLAAESQVVDSIADAGVPALVLKGCLLGYLVYPRPEQRWRSDLDLLVSPSCIDDAREVLRATGYKPAWQTTGGTPSHQQTWIRPSGPQIDLHWQLRNHPALRGVLDFEEQWDSAVALPGLGEGASGQCRVHALLNASMHWFDELLPQFRPLVWLLDKDLLWRSMTERERAQATELAAARGIAGLLAESLRLAAAVFDTPVDRAVLEQLQQTGRTQRATWLKTTNRHPVRNWLFALRCERGLKARLNRLRASLFPPPALMREKYPEGSRLGLVGLYLKRAMRGSLFRRR